MSTEATLAQALDRPGGSPARRALALFHGAGVLGRFDAVTALLDLGRARGVTRLAFEEAALQVAAYGGFPRALECLGAVAAAWGPRADPAPADPRDARTLAAAGRRSFDAIYAGNAERVLAELAALLPGLDRIVLGSAYAPILSRPGLAPAERELLAVAALALAALPRPLESHLRGALHHGVAPAEAEDILLTCPPLADARALEVIAQAVERLSRKVPPR